MNQRSITVSLVVITLLSAGFLCSNTVSADTSVTKNAKIIVPPVCSIGATGMNTHTTTVEIGTYKTNIGTTTATVTCNDSEGFSIYASGFTGDKVGETNSNKLVGTSISSNATISTGTTSSGGTSSWSMKLAPDTSSNPQYPITILSTYSDYANVPSDYTKVATRTAATDIGTGAEGSTFTTTYAAYISNTQAADTYTGKVKYVLVHPNTAPAPVGQDKVGITYHANGSTFTGGGTTNRVIYGSSPMYIATTPQIFKTTNIDNNGDQNGSYPVTAEPVLVPISATGASKMKVVIRYGFSADSAMLVINGAWDGEFTSIPGRYETLYGPAADTVTYTFDGDAITLYYMLSTPVSTDGQDYGYYIQVYPIYTTEQADTEPSTEYAASVSVDEGTYAQTTDWYGSWYAEINDEHYDFMNETEITEFLKGNIATIGGTNIDLYRGLTFTEAYTRANKSQDSGYYKQQDLNNSMCKTVSVAQNLVVKDVRDNNTYMIGRLKDGRCWMLDNLALDPTDPTTAFNMNASNTNASAEAINNYLNGGSTTAGWSNVAVVKKTSGWNIGSSNPDTQPYINTQSRDALVTSYGPASTNGQAKVGIYYNFCAASIGTYCYAYSNVVDIPGTDIDAPQDICPAGWRMPTGDAGSGEYGALVDKYTTDDATDTSSLQYNLSTPLSGYFFNSSVSYSGERGIFWSSTYDDNYTMNTLSAAPSFVSGFHWSNIVGYSMRCIVSN